MRQPTRRPPRPGRSSPPHHRNARGEGNKPEEDPNLPQALERGDHHAEQEQPADYLEDDAHEARTLATAVAVGRLWLVMQRGVRCADGKSVTNDADAVTTPVPARPRRATHCGPGRCDGRGGG